MLKQNLSTDEAYPFKMAAEARSDMPLVTVLTSSHGPIVKCFRLVEGAVEITPAAQIHRGAAQTFAVEGPASLLRLIDSLAPNQALSLGRLEQVGSGVLSHRSICAEAAKSHEQRNSSSGTMAQRACSLM